MTERGWRGLMLGFASKKPAVVVTSLSAAEGRVPRWTFVNGSWRAKTRPMRRPRIRVRRLAGESI